MKEPMVQDLLAFVFVNAHAPDDFQTYSLDVFVLFVEHHDRNDVLVYLLVGHVGDVFNLFADLLEDANSLFDNRTVVVLCLEYSA